MFPRIVTLLIATSAFGLTACGEVTSDGGTGEDSSGGNPSTGGGGSSAGGSGEVTSGGASAAGGSPTKACEELIDPSLSAALRERLGLPVGAELSAEEVVDVPMLSAEGVTSLAGLSCLPSLTGLTILNSPDLVALEPLSQIPQLVNLEMHGVMATDYSVLPELSALQVVSVTGGPLRDLSPLVTSPHLKHLFVSEVAVSDLAPLTMAATESLGSLSVTRAALTDLSPLLDASFLPGTLYIQDNPLSELAINEQIPQLVELGWCVVTGSLPDGEEHPPGCVPSDKP